MTERGERWQLRIMAAVIALGAWFFVGLQNRERQSEKQIDANVTYSVPRGVILLDPVQKVAVRLRGNTSAIRDLNPFAVDVFVEVRQSDRGLVEVALDEENVLMPRGLELISIEPKLLRLSLDREGTRTLPVEARLTGEPAAAAVVQRVQVMPETVVVTGPESQLAALERLSTTPVSLDGHAIPYVETVAVIAPSPLVRLLPSVVQVRIDLGLPSLAEEDQPAAGEAAATRPRRRP